MKKIIVILVVVILAGVLSFFILGRSVNLQLMDETEIEKIEINAEVPEITLPLSTNPKDLAWALFQKYLGYNKNRNLEGVKSVVYKVNPVCEDIKTTIECQSRMGLAYMYGNALKKKDFINIWNDEKQVILATDFKIEEDDNSIVRSRTIIFFIRDEAGNLRLLSFSPFKGAVTSKGTASKEELDYRIIRYTEDKDEDGIADYDEECLAAKEGEICVKTNPKLRDTDGDGWWDGIEALMN